MKTIVITLILIFASTFVYAEKSCNELIKSIFSSSEQTLTPEQTKLQNTLLDDLKANYVDHPLKEIFDDIAKEIAKEVSCSQTENVIKKSMEKVVEQFEDDIEDYSKKKREYIKLFGKVLKGSCKKMDK